MSVGIPVLLMIPFPKILLTRVVLQCLWRSLFPLHHQLCFQKSYKGWNGTECYQFKINKDKNQQQQQEWKEIVQILSDFMKIERTMYLSWLIVKILPKWKRYIWNIILLGDNAEKNGTLISAGYFLYFTLCGFVFISPSFHFL